MRAIDLNSDLGESYAPVVVGDDAGMLPLVTSANLACGYHGGDPATMAQAVALAAELGVVIGAHPSYDDREHFGRRDLDVAPAVLAAQLDEQLATLRSAADRAGAAVRYLKPHGALYNRIVHDAERAAVVAEAAARAGLPVMGMPASAIEAAAASLGVGFIAEAFADRAYRADGSLVPRTQPGAVIHDAEIVAARAVRIATEGRITTIDGGEIVVRAQSLCVHGDTPGAVELARSVRAALLDAGVDLRPAV